MLSGGMYKPSLNRSYYSIFHAMRAITALEGFDSSKHSGVIAYFNQDLKAKAMMGDTGSNVLGISIGILFVMGYPLKVRLIWLAFLIFIHILTEKYSLTKIIENNKFLNFIDKLGR